MVAMVIVALFVFAGFDVNKVGDARIGFVGFPSVGKSTLLTKLTGTFSEVGWALTLSCVCAQYACSIVQAGHIH